MTIKTVKLRINKGIAFVTLNNPPVNLLTIKIIDEIKNIVKEVENDNRAKVWIMTASGDKFFSAGIDVKEIKDDSIAKLNIMGNEAFTAIDNLEIPTIVAINGSALGGGLELAMAHDLRIASSAITNFSQPEVRLGIIPGAGGTQRMTRLIGRARASELILTGNSITAETAMSWGLVNRVVPYEDLLAIARELAMTIMENSPVAVKQAKKAIRMASRVMDLQAGIEFEKLCFNNCYFSNDRVEGISAFLEKRKPDFQ
ncbi:MAG: enoyl-CoA hydratase/isomerase family protein [Candidatus Hodarchaeales archaeon]